MSNGKTYDLKIGYTCNNNCIHCVVKPDYQDWIDAGIPIDVPYGELISIVNSQEFADANHVVITGGEPTVRKEFLRLLLYIQNKYPSKRISLQTNGRNLRKYVKDIYENNINIFYVIALHGCSDIHNKVIQVNGADAFSQTMESIEEIKSVYGSFNTVGRIEIVLSKVNYREIPSFVEYLYKLNIRNVGISYPHLDGYAVRDINFVKEIGFSYGCLKEILPDFYELCMKHDDLYLQFEQVPACMWRNREGALYKLPRNIQSMDHIPQQQTTVKFPNRNIDTDFFLTYKNMHNKTKACSTCLDCNCMGVWWEAVSAFGEEGFIPISKNELEVD